MAGIEARRLQEIERAGAAEGDILIERILELGKPVVSDHDAAGAGDGRNNIDDTAVGVQRAVIGDATAELERAVLNVHGSCVGEREAENRRAVSGLGVGALVGDGVGAQRAADAQSPTGRAAGGFISDCGGQGQGADVHVDYFFFQAEDGIRDYKVTGVQTCALPIWLFWQRRTRRRTCPANGWMNWNG